MSDAAIVLTQARYALATALRTRRTIFLSVIFPVILLVLFNSIFTQGGDQTTTLPNGTRMDIQAYFTAGLLAYAATLSTFTTLAVVITTKRERGELKRFRGTPMPAWTFVAAWVLRALAQVALMAVVLLGIGALAYGVHIPTGQLAGLVIYLLLGTATMCALGIAVTAFTPTVDAASTIAPFTVVILSFFSGVWIPVDNLSGTLEHLGKLFPLFHLADGLQTTLAQGASGIGLSGSNVTALLVWAAIAIGVATRRFLWEPQAARG
jgi:ABC-2 type transport system permease protein